jgi:capsular polysaccharide biosynthesis protein
MESQTSNVVNLKNNLGEHHIINMMLTNDQFYQALLARMKEASVASTMVTSSVALISPAKIPLRPYLPKKFLNRSLAAVIGLIGGIGRQEKCSVNLNLCPY